MEESDKFFGSFQLYANAFRERCGIFINEFGQITLDLPILNFYEYDNHYVGEVSNQSLSCQTKDEGFNGCTVVAIDQAESCEEALEGHRRDRPERDYFDLELQTVIDKLDDNSLFDLCDKDWRKAYAPDSMTSSFTQTTFAGVDEDIMFGMGKLLRPWMKEHGICTREDLKDDFESVAS